jgi:hypothetical protein
MPEQKIDDSKTLRILYDQSKELNATDAHFTANKIFHDETATGVFSVYIGLKPDHMVLAELLQQAEDDGDQALIDKIQHIREDISFLEEEA